MNARQQAKAATYDRILRAAREEFLAKGWRGSTVRSIARRAGNSTGAFFACFADKDDAWRAATGLQTPDEWAREALRGLK